ncbi:type II secretion system F family protein [Candidatus Sumerlaeota bacterium]|nr:type II secretion system F family protein [Candidatus Sumerlaeota bacterium]
MAKDTGESRARQLRDAIASKLREKSDQETLAGGQPARPAGQRPSEPHHRPGEPGVEQLTVGETVRQILGTRISLTGPKVQDIATMCRQLATLIDVGIPLLRSIKILAERTQHPQLRQILREIADDVEQGSPLSTAMKKHPRIIPPLITNIVQIGEKGGILEDTLRRLAEIYERKAEIKRKVLAAMAYPIAAIIVAISVVALIFAYAIPVFQEVYTQKENVELPRITQQVIAVSEFVRGWWALYIPLLVLIFILAVWYGRTVPGRRLYDRLRLRLPIMGPINIKINVARVTRTLSNLLSAGIPLLEALSSTATSSENVIIAEALIRTRDSVEEGEKMEPALRESRVIPPMVVDMIAIGDEAGALDNVLDRMADVYEGEVDASLKGLVALIEPLLIIFLGIVVILIAFAILLPYWNIGDLIE